MESEYESTASRGSKTSTSHYKYRLTRPHEPAPELHCDIHAGLGCDRHKSTVWQRKVAGVLTAQNGLVDQRFGAGVTQLHLSNHTTPCYHTKTNDSL